ncbi:protein of unknown function [Paraburkholderia kururiensis]
MHDAPSALRHGETGTPMPCARRTDRPLELLDSVRRAVIMAIFASRHLAESVTGSSESRAPAQVAELVDALVSGTSG